MKEEKYFSWWTAGDWNGFFGLFTNIITNIMVLTSLLLYAVKIPPNIVFGRVLPAVGLSLIVGNIYYGFAARKLALKEKRGDVTALPYGISVGHMFVVTFLIIGPVFWKTGNPVLAWQVGIAWCLIESVIEILGAAVGPFIRKHTPRAAMLGVVAGLSVTLIGMKPAMESWEVPYISLVCLGLVFIGWIARKNLPGNVPAGLAIIIVGSIIGWATGYMKPEAFSAAIANMSASSPKFSFGDLVEGLKQIGPYLIVALPLGVGNALSTLDNIESAAAAGDVYDTRECMVVDGIGSLVGAVLGSPFPTTVYIGHAGWKSVGAKTGYSIATGVCAFLVCILGIVPVLLTVVPLVALLPILIYIALVMGAQAFQATPREHAPAVIFAFIPWLANWGLTQVDNALTAAGTNAAKVGFAALNSAGVTYKGMQILSNGAIVTSMVLAAITVYIIDGKYKNASYYALAGAILSFFGVMHAGMIGIGVGIQPAIGYLCIAVLIYVMPMMSDIKGKKDKVVGEEITQ